MTQYTKVTMAKCPGCNIQFEKCFTGKQKTNQAWEWINNGKSFCGKKCPSCIKNRFNNTRRANQFAACKKYEKTKPGYLMRTYRNMLSRVSGILKKKAHLYRGLSILSKHEFYEWAGNDERFHLLFEKYKHSNFNIKLSPSINRIDTNTGYVHGNMEWITHSENSRLGSISSKRYKAGAKGINDSKPVGPIIKPLL